MNLINDHDAVCQNRQQAQGAVVLSQEGQKLVHGCAEDPFAPIGQSEQAVLCSVFLIMPGVLLILKHALNVVLRSPVQKRRVLTTSPRNVVPASFSGCTPSR